MTPRPLLRPSIAALAVTLSSAFCWAQEDDGQGEQPTAPPVTAPQDLADAGVTAAPGTLILERVLGPGTCETMPKGLCFENAATWQSNLDEVRKAVGCSWFAASRTAALDGLLDDLEATLTGELAAYRGSGRNADPLLSRVLKYERCHFSEKTGSQETREVTIVSLQLPNHSPQIVSVAMTYTKNGNMDFEVVRDRLIKDASAIVGDTPVKSRGAARFYVLKTPKETGVVYFEPKGNPNAPLDRIFMNKSVTRTDLFPSMARAVKEQVQADWLAEELRTTSMPDLKELAAYRVTVARKKLANDPDQVLRELEPLLTFEFDKAEVEAVLTEARAAIQKREEARLGAVLTREVGRGGPVAVLPTSKGLMAIGTESKEKRTLAPGPIRWALVDNRAKAIWFGRSSKKESSIHLIDLQGTGAELPVVTGLPPNLDVMVMYAAGALRFDEAGNTNVVIDLSGKGQLFSFNGGISGQYDPSSVTKVARAVALARVDGGLLESVRKRALASTPAPAVTPVAHVVQLGKKACAEADGHACLRALEIPGTTLWAVQTEAVCGDGCYFKHELFDSTTKQFFDIVHPKARALVPHKNPAPLSGARLSSDGSAIVVGGKVLRLADGVSSGEAGLGGGFIGGDLEVPLTMDM